MVIGQIHLKEIEDEFPNVVNLHINHIDGMPLLKFILWPFAGPSLLPGIADPTPWTNREAPE